jgi:hypothetical protein
MVMDLEFPGHDNIAHRQADRAASDPKVMGVNLPRIYEGLARLVDLTSSAEPARLANVLRGQRQLTRSKLESGHTLPEGALDQTIRRYYSQAEAIAEVEKKLS